MKKVFQQVTIQMRKIC